MRIAPPAGDRLARMTRFVGNEKDGLVEIGAKHAYKVGDRVFWATASTAGQGLFIGRLKASPDVLVLIVGRRSRRRRRNARLPAAAFRQRPQAGAAPTSRSAPARWHPEPPRTRVVCSLSCNPRRR
jgi:hypothetical protein